MYPRRWDLALAYYGNDDANFAELEKHSAYAFRTSGSKFQNLKKLLDRSPHILDGYTHVCVCDDDIQMTPRQIDQLFGLSEQLGFWVAQPAFSPAGKWSHEITICAGKKSDYRIVNFVEVTMPVFRRDKLMQFMKVYDDTLVGLGIDCWYSDFLQAHLFGRFAIIDKISVINPTDEEKGHREIDRLQSFEERVASWIGISEKYGIVAHPHQVFAYCKMAPRGDTGKRSRARILLGKLQKARARAKHLLRSRVT
ncbi:hypothetical protein [Bradyrhizobium sp. SRS-191]|uniref:hypothetical protein n=1 Tax=Bradyrhizobium sp. SRS-191 TaxID=2962606 RepID=UPI00211EB0AC|nr:hypothetical protein [Bradyrhizobium sp. SRS-191]